MNDLKATEKRVIISVDLEAKNSHRFSDGTTIRLERKFNNLNQRETQPVNAFIIDAEFIPKGAEVLISHNALHDVNKIFGYRAVGGDDITNNVQYFSVPESDCFLWREGTDEWMPCKGYATALRIFKPYTGSLKGVYPTEIKNILYLTSGEYSNKVAHTLKACDYEIVYQGDDGKEKRVIRCRHFEDEDNEREELIAIDNFLTEQVNDGKLLIGLSVTDCKYLKTLQNA